MFQQGIQKIGLQQENPVPSVAIRKPLCTNFLYFNLVYIWQLLKYLVERKGRNIEKDMEEQHIEMFITKTKKEADS